MSNEDRNSQLGKLYGLIHTLAFLFALYLAFRCEYGINFGSLLMACCCPWIYIIYIMATRNNFCS